MAGHMSLDRHHAMMRTMAKWLCLAAAPTFAIMALLNYLSGGSVEMICNVTGGASPLGSMVPMYALMSAFHSAPWLRWIAHSQSAASQRHAKVWAKPLSNGSDLADRHMLSMSGLRISQTQQPIASSLKGKAS